MKALIAGGGIGGLTTALYLHRVGIAVEVFEQADEIRELGVGINMLPRAVNEMAELGLLAELDAQGIRTHELIYANRLGQVVWQELRGVDAGCDHPQISVHRGTLLGLIYKAAIERLERFEGAPAEPELTVVIILDDRRAVALGPCEQRLPALQAHRYAQ